MKYLVLRKDIIKRRGTSTIQSSCFPIEVDMGNKDPETYTPDDIVKQACEQLSHGYRGNREYTYVVIPMREAIVVAYRKPQPQYDVFVTDYC